MADFNKNQPLTDEEFKLALKQQQEAYQARDDRPTDGGSSSSSAPSNKKNNSKYTVRRSGGGKSWEDPSLLDWNPKHFRLFVGNLSGEVNDDMLKAAFTPYKSVTKTRIVTDPKTGLCKGYGFVAFESSDDYFRAYKEVNGKYIGNHPCQLKRAQTEVKAVKKGRHNHHKTPYSR